MSVNQAARAAWAKELRRDRDNERRHDWQEFRPGYPRSWWEQHAQERLNRGEDDPWDYEWHKETFMEAFNAALGLEGIEQRRWSMGASTGFQAGLMWAEQTRQTEPYWDAINRMLVEEGRAPGRGRGGPFYPHTWWYEAAKWDDEDRNPKLKVPESKLPAELNDRIILLCLTHVRGAMKRWSIRRAMGRDDKDFSHDVDGELGSVGSCEIPWSGEWIHASFNGTGQEGHGYSKNFGIWTGDYSARTKINHKTILRVARRVFRVPTLYAAGVDDDTGQAAFF